MGAPSVAPLDLLIPEGPVAVPVAPAVRGAGRAWRGLRPEPASQPRLIEIVATPGSGNGRAARTALRLGEILRACGHEVRLDVFPDLERLRRWAETGGSRFGLLICVGGDGTQSAAAPAAFRRSVPFLPVPAGFGNLFARAFGHTPDVDRVRELLARGHVVHADVGVRNGVPFLCSEAFGLVSELQQRVERSLTRPRARWRRWLTYYRAALGHLRAVPLPSFEVAVDGELVADDAAIVTVANVKTYGPWLPLTPAASPVDGLFDVFVMRRTTKSQILAGLVRRQLRLPGVEHGTRLDRGRRVSVRRSGSAGDAIELIPGLLPVVVSPATAAALQQEVVSAGGGAGLGAAQLV
jgi:diacylglycerol kinase (ATP)